MEQDIQSNLGHFYSFFVCVNATSGGIVARVDLQFNRGDFFFPRGESCKKKI